LPSITLITGPSNPTAIVIRRRRSS
jgi:hypothetical protein